ncbi:MAG: ribulose-phosphate 3-epimerase [Oscillospiraceae bacterium]|nr:ribulose-phosphate 3-epimerase [Oscillospiraceae bacterium]
MIRIAPSVLACDFSVLGAEAARMQDCGAEMLHLDVMDGMFVPNISFGAPVIRAIRDKSRAQFDVHLMICDPLRYIDDFRAAGADSITFHIEAAEAPKKVIDAIHAAGCRAAVSVKPGTPVETVYPFLQDLEMVLVMTVEPGFGGQAFLPQMCQKIAALRKECTERGLSTDIQVDGGINASTVREAAAAGANVFVAGSAVFRSADAAAVIAQLRTSAEEAYGTQL